MHHVILQEHRRNDVNHPIVILDDDDDLGDLSQYHYPREESTTTSLPPAFNPEFVVGANKSTSIAPVTMQTADEVQAATAPVPAETVDPFIAAVFQHGFSCWDSNPNVMDNEETKDDSTTRSDFGPRTCLDDNIMKERTLVSPNDRLEKRFVQEPRRIKANASNRDTTSTASVDDTKTTATALESTEKTNASSSKSSSSKIPSSATLVPALLVPAVTGHGDDNLPRDGTKANPPSAPRFIPLTQHQSHYDRLKPYAQLVAWRTQQHARYALERGLVLTKKHAPTVKRMATKSYKAIRKVSQRSIALAVHHGPIVGRKMKRASILRGGLEHPIVGNSKKGLYNLWRRQRGTRASF